MYSLPSPQGGGKTDAPAGALWLRQARVRLRDMGQAGQHVGAGWAGTAADCVDVHVHLLRHRQRRVIVRAVKRVEEVEPLLVEAKHLRAHLDPVAGAGLTKVREV